MNEDQATRIATNAIDYQAAQVAERDERIKQLERQCAMLAAEIDRQHAEYNAEVNEFNAGYEAAQQGLPESSEPPDVKYDVWKCGYAWAMFDKLKVEIDLMRPVVEATVKQIRRDDDLFSWSDLKDAVDAYEAAKQRNDSQHVADTQGPPTPIGRVGGIPIMKINDGKRR